jgi:predicted MFS family arabinose efflux permease
MILPLCIVFGRRPVLLGCCILLVGSTIGAATSRSFEEHMACRILQGIATGATESVSLYCAERCNRSIVADVPPPFRFSLSS